MVARRGGRSSASSPGDLHAGLLPADPREPRIGVVGGVALPDAVRRARDGVR